MVVFRVTREKYAKDLTGEGYEITNIFVERTQTTSEVKELVKFALITFLPKPEVLFIIGHVPVPYSGLYSRNGDLKSVV
jgi:hypothetical protein